METTTIGRAFTGNHCLLQVVMYSVSWALALPSPSTHQHGHWARSALAGLLASAPIIAGGIASASFDSVSQVFQIVHFPYFPLCQRSRINSIALVEAYINILYKH